MSRKIEVKLLITAGSRSGQLQSAAKKTLQCSCVNVFYSPAPGCILYVSGRWGTYSISLLFYTVNRFCDRTHTYIYNIYIFIYLGASSSYYTISFVRVVCMLDALHFTIRWDSFEQVCVCSPNHRFWGWGWYDELRYYDTVFYQTDDLTNQNRKKINGISFPKMSKPVLGMYDMYPYGVPLLGTNNLDVQRSEFAENLSNNWQCVVLSQVNLWERPVWQGPQQGPVI